MNIVGRNPAGYCRPESGRQNRPAFGRISGFFWNPKWRSSRSNSGLWKSLCDPIEYIVASSGNIDYKQIYEECLSLNLKKLVKKRFVILDTNQIDRKRITRFTLAAIRALSGNRDGLIFIVDPNFETAKLRQSSPQNQGQIPTPVSVPEKT